MKACGHPIKKHARCRLMILKWQYGCQYHRKYVLQADHHTYCQYNIENNVFPLDIWNEIYQRLDYESLSRLSIASILHYEGISSYLTKNSFYATISKQVSYYAEPIVPTAGLSYYMLQDSRDIYYDAHWNLMFYKTGHCIYTGKMCPGAVKIKWQSQYEKMMKITIFIRVSTYYLGCK